jgi:hypothetical protein
MGNDLICWWCVHPLPQLPCYHLPIKYDEMRKKYITKGNFCSWECMKAYALSLNTAKVYEMCSWIALMRKHAYGKVIPLIAAPNRYSLKCFGGPYTIEEFRACFGNTPPPVSWPDSVQIHQKIGADPQVPAISVARSNSNSNSKLRAIEESQSTGDTLKLKRNKPLARTTSKLESALGITRKAK